MFTLRFCLVASVLTLAGCSTYTETTANMTQSRRTGKVDVAAQQATALAQQHKADNDKVVYTLEAGSATRVLALSKLSIPANGETSYTQSIQYFSKADDDIDNYEVEAKRSLSAGVSTTVINPATCPYRGRDYDKVMTSTYQALNYLAVNNIEAARASLNKAYRRQQDAVEENAKRIEREQARIEAASQGQVTADGKAASEKVDYSETDKNPKVTAQLDQLNLSLDTHIKAYADYVNPFTTFLDGLFMMTNSTDSQEQERAAKEFLRVASMESENPFLQEDAALAEALAKGGSVPNLTYVIFESGEAAFRQELLIPAPIILPSNHQPILAVVPISRLIYCDACNPQLVVDAGSEHKMTARICDMDSVIARDFKNQIRSMWVDALLCASTKALIQYEVNRNVDRNSSGNPWAGLIVKVVSQAVNSATTRADTRSWRSLPKTFAYTRLATPESRSLTVSTPDGQSSQVTLPQAKVSVVYVKQSQPGTPLLVDHFKLL